MANDDILWRNIGDLKQASDSSQRSPSKGQRESQKTSVTEKPTDNTTSLHTTNTDATIGDTPPLGRLTPHDTTKQASKQEAMQSSKLASYHASKQADMIEEIRRVVKAIGAKTTFVRLTPEEKSRLLEVVYSYKRQGVKTSENELTRIAISYLLGDYDERGNESMLAKVLAALNA